MPYPKGKPQSEESKRLRRETMLRRIAEDPEWTKKASRAGKAGTTPEAQMKRRVSMVANGTIDNPIRAMSESMSRPDVRARLSAERKHRFNETAAGRAHIARIQSLAQLPEARAKQLAALRAYVQTPEGREARRRGGDAALHALRGASANRKWDYTHANGITYRFRSSWELTFARWLDQLGIRWEYEPRTFVLPDGSRYTPDFLVFIPGQEPVWVEVKGVRRFGAKKFEAFRSLGYRCVMLSDEEIGVMR